MIILRALVLCLPLAALAQEELSPAQKIRLARDLARRGPEAIAQLKPLLTDNDVEVRREAVKSVVAIGSQHSLDALVLSCGDGDGEVQIRATDGLVNFYLPGYVDTGLSGTLRRAGNVISARWRSDENRDVIDPDLHVRPEIIEALGKIIAGGSSTVARANAARAAGILRGQATLPHLIEALRSKDDRLIFESLIAIQKIADPESGPRVIFLLRDLEEKVQIAAVETAGLLRTTDAVPDLERVLESTSSRRVRRAAIAALAHIAAPASRDMFFRYLNDRDDDMRAAAAEGVGRIARPEDREPLLRLYQEERKTGPRLALAFALVALGETATAELTPLRDLISNLNMRAWTGVASPYLRELSRKEGVRQALYPAMAAGTRDEKIGLALALSGSGAADAVAPLEQLVRDPDPQVGSEAVRALRILRASLR